MAPAAATADRRLIINADDFGLSPGVTRGILDAVRAGVVTSTSIFVTTPGWDRELGALGAGVSTGLHLDLTAGAPACAPAAIPSLVDRAGRFYSLGRLGLRALAGLVRADDVARETAAQLGRLGAAGSTVTHVDGHRHVQALPVVAAGIRRAAPGVRVRRPAEPALAGRPGTVKRLVIGTLARASGGAHDRARVAGIGMDGRRHYQAELLAILDRLQPGLTELVVHPGYADAATRALDGYDEAREGELAALLSGEVRQRLARGDITLVGQPAIAA